MARNSTPDRKKPHKNDVYLPIKCICSSSISPIRFERSFPILCLLIYFKVVISFGNNGTTTNKLIRKMCIEKSFIS